MKWKNGFSATYYAYVVDPVSWRETDRIEITGGTVSRTGEGLRDSADLECTSFDNSRELYIRVYLDAEQNGATAHTPLFTGLAANPLRDIYGFYEKNTVACYSVLKAAEDVLLDRGFFIPSGSNGAEVIKDLLSVTPAPVSVNGVSPELQSAIIAEEGETRLSMADKVLTAIGWRMRISGMGEIELCPMPTEVSAQFDPVDQDVLEPSIQVEYDWYSCPNVLRVVQDDLSAIARDDSPDSPLSTVSRGREVWAEESSCELSTGESISEYAVRRLGELQRVRLSGTYVRRFFPDVLVGDLVKLQYPGQGLDGLFRITEQTIELAHGARTSEKVEAV